MKLRLAIVAAQRKQRQVAAAAGITENRLSEIVNGWLEPRDDEKAAIARALDQPIDALFDEARAAR